MGRGHHYTTGVHGRLSLSSSKRVVQLEEECKPLDAYIAEREASEARATRLAAQEAKSRREQMLELAKRVPRIRRLPDKRRVAFTKGGKKIKTRVRKQAAGLRLTGTRRPRKMKYR